jgi:O-antigen ligase
MGITKRLNWQNIFIFLFLVIFPFGQIIRIGILQPIDFIVGLAAVYTILKKLETPRVIKYFGLFVLFASLTWIFSIFIFRQIDVLYGLLYLFRLVAYYFFGIYVWNFVKKVANSKMLLMDSLLVVSIISSIFGWVQFFTFPDIKNLFRFGWDIHLFRLVGTFLDPTFLGLIIVFGLLISITRMVEAKNKKYLGIILFLLLSLAFTYSRGSYLALFAGLIVIALYNKILKKVFFFILIFMILLFTLPTSRNHSIELFRSFSAVARIEDYKTTLQIFSKSPVFGIGYNNMCIAYQKYIGVQPFSSHHCSGSDSSLLLVLATTGIAGFMIFIYSIYNIGVSLKRDFRFQILMSSFTALVVHSLFSNSLFYPWIIGYLIILLALAIRE